MNFRKTAAALAPLLLALFVLVLYSTALAQSRNGNDQVLQSSPIITGTNMPPNLPAASPITIYYSIPLVGTAYEYYNATGALVTGTYYTTGTGQSYVYTKVIGSGTNGWVQTSGTGPIVQ
jgi:hypothetical protein